MHNPLTQGRYRWRRDKMLEERHPKVKTQTRLKRDKYKTKPGIWESQVTSGWRLTWKATAVSGGNLPHNDVTGYSDMVVAGHHDWIGSALGRTHLICLREEENQNTTNWERIVRAKEWKHSITCRYCMQRFHVKISMTMNIIFEIKGNIERSWVRQWRDQLQSI